MLTREEIKAIVLGTPASELRSILGEIEDETGLDLTPVRPEMERPIPVYGAAPFVYEDYYTAPEYTFMTVPV